MRTNLRGVSLAVVPLLFCLNAAQAQVHTVTPQQYVVKAQGGVTTAVLPNEEEFSVKSTGAGVIAINLGWMKVQPNLAYNAKVHVRGIDLTDTANVSLMIREHKD